MQNWNTGCIGVYEAAPGPLGWYKESGSVKTDLYMWPVPDFMNKALLKLHWGTDYQSHQYKNMGYNFRYMPYHKGISLKESNISWGYRMGE